MFASSHLPVPNTHECSFLLELGRAPCLTGTVPTCQVVVGVVVVWVKKGDPGLVWQGVQQRAEEVREVVSEEASLALGVWVEEERSEMATAMGTVEAKVRDWPWMASAGTSYAMFAREESAVASDTQTLTRYQTWECRRTNSSFVTIIKIRSACAPTVALSTDPKRMRTITRRRESYLSD